MKVITEISDKLSGLINETTLTYIGKPDYYIWYQSAIASDAIIASGDNHYFSSQGNTFNTIFNDNITRYKKAIKDISDLKRENVTITMRRDN